MNFLTMVQNVRLEAGMQGTGPTSVVGTVGVDSVIVQFIKQAYRDIQNMREEWAWLRKDVTFTTTVGKSVYTTSDILGVLTNDLKDYKSGTIRLLNNGTTSYLKHYDEDYLQRLYVDSTTQGTPTAYAIDSADRSLILKDTPDTSYTVSFSYYTIPESLTNDTDIPRLPVSFHDLIVYKALQKLSVYLKVPEIFSNSSIDGATLMGQLMRNTLKPKRITTRPLA